MAKTPPFGTKPDPRQLPTDETLESGFYEVTPSDAGEQAAPASPSLDPETREESTGPTLLESYPGRDLNRSLEVSTPAGGFLVRPRNTRSLKIAAVAIALVLVLGGVLLVRRQRQQRALREGLVKAAELMRADTYAGYVAAADLLKSLVPINSLEAGSVRAFALGMLVSDYREEARIPEAESLLVEPERAAEVTAIANLAEAALLLSREAGTATTFAARAPSNPWSGTLQARVALWAGNLPTALDLVNNALSIDPNFPAALALKGDILRRRRNDNDARDAYTAALRESATHPRAVFGLAKLALSEKLPREQAMRPLEQMLADPATHSNERARAALHLAALRGRAGDRAGAAAAIEAARVSPAARSWLEKAVSEEELSRTGYHVVSGAPPELLSPHDDDPYVSQPPPPPPAADPPKADPPKAAVKAEPTKHLKSHFRAPAKSKAKTAKAAKPIKGTKNQKVVTKKKTAIKKKSTTPHP